MEKETVRVLCVIKESIGYSLAFGDRMSLPLNNSLFDAISFSLLRVSWY